MFNYFISQAKLVEGETLSWVERVCNGGGDSIMTGANL